MPDWLQGDVLDVRMTVTQSLPKAPRVSLEIIAVGSRRHYPYARLPNVRDAVL